MGKENKEQMLKALCKWLNKPELAVNRQWIADSAKDVADMQVLDYIIGYKRKIGEKDLDIDLDSMLVISKETADILNDLDSETLQEVLGNTDAGVDEVKECISRFTLLKERIKQGQVYPDEIKDVPGAATMGKLCIIKDNAWKKLSLYDISKVHKHPRKERELQVAWMLYYALIADPKANYFGSSIAYLYGIAPNKEDKIKTEKVVQATVELGESYHLVLGAEAAERNIAVLDKMLFKLELLMGAKDKPAPPEFIEIKEDLRHAMNVNQQIAQKSKGKKHPNPFDILKMQASFDKLRQDAKRARESIVEGNGGDRVSLERASLAESIEKQAKEKIAEIKRADQEMITEINKKTLIDVAKIQKLQSIVAPYETKKDPTIEETLEQLRSINQLVHDNQEPSAMFYALAPRLEKVLSRIVDTPEQLEHAVAAGLNKEDIANSVFSLKLCEREEVINNELRNEKYREEVKPSPYVEKMNSVIKSVPDAPKELPVVTGEEAPVLGSKQDEIPVLH